MSVEQDQHAPLRDNVRLLGEELGVVLREQSGERLYDTVETIRQAAVESRSSQNAIGNGKMRPRLRANDRVDCARGPSVPSIFNGRPSTSPTILRSSASAFSRSASGVNFFRRIVSTLVAT